MKNILVISELFEGGGVETQILNQTKHLKNYNINIHLASSSKLDNIPFGIFSSLHPKLKFSGATTANELLKTINTLLKVVEYHNIDIIHAHPFWSAIISMPVAQISKLPLLYTIHGPSSLYFPNPDSISSLLLHSALLPNASRIIAVSQETKFLTEMFTDQPIDILPNSIEVPLSKIKADTYNKPWLWAGRLDQEKIKGLVKLIDYVSSTSTLKLDVYGSGENKNVIIDYIKNNERITYCGWSENLTSIMCDYGVICGMGRVILEATAQNHPCILLGYDGIKGFMTSELAKKSSYWNISGRGINNITSSEIDEQLKNINADKYYLHEWALDNRSNEIVFKSYLNLLTPLKPFESKLASVFFESLHFLGDSYEPYWESHVIYNHLKNFSYTHK